MPRTLPTVLHRFPDEPMCRSSSNLGETKVWCGMGWTGQPLIAERKDRRWAIFGGYDGNIHFMDALTGERILPDVETGDIIKGTPTVDPDGYPLVYSGSRDNLLRVIAIDRPGQAEVLWTLDSESVPPNLWNDDWDSSPIILGDYLVDGQREQPLLGDQAQPLLRQGHRAGAGRPRRWCSPHRSGTRRCSPPTATSTPRSRARSPSTRTPPTSAPRPGSSGATT